jgi:cyclophilin family peptidyl-prolyl cis-trans isomerase
MCYFLLCYCVIFADWLDNKHVVYGRVIKDGLLVVLQTQHVTSVTSCSLQIG